MEYAEIIKGRVNLADAFTFYGYKPNGSGMLICPFHSERTASMKIYPNNTYYCFGCRKSGDVINLVMELHGIGFPQALVRINYDFGLGLPIGRDADDAEIERIRQAARMHRQAEPAEEPKVDYLDYFIAMNKNIGNTDYHRGLSIETLNHFLVGYDAEWRHPKTLDRNLPASPRLIIPTSRYSYTARDTRDDKTLSDKQKQYKKMKVGNTSVFNFKSLVSSVRPVFIVEGEIDAMSIHEVGGNAVALGSTTNIKRLVQMLKVNAPNVPLILSLDNDGSGSNAQNELGGYLESIGIDHYFADIAQGCKDANELLCKDKKALKAAVNDAMRQAERM